MEKLGKVTKRLFSPGSKSEHEAVFLQTENDEFVLRRQGGNAFQDEVLDNLVGKKIRCEGVEHNYTFIISDWEEIQ